MTTNSSFAGLVRRIATALPPAPWEDARAIPWSDPEFSRRMLREHLDQSHDRASRRVSIIDAHVDWIHDRILHSKPSRILDLGCGPGLYTQRLAERGHACTGIDCSPAAIDYARAQAQKTGANCIYRLEDIRTTEDYRFGGQPYDLILFIYGEFCMIKPEAARVILDRCRCALKPEGSMLLEVLTADAVIRMGTQSRYWCIRKDGVMSDHPYLCLEEYFYCPERSVSLIRYWFADCENGALNSFTQTCALWHHRQLQSLFLSARFDPAVMPFALAGITDDNEDDLETWILSVPAENSDDDGQQTRHDANKQVGRQDDSAARTAARKFISTQE